MTTAPPTTSLPADRILDVLQRYWGFKALRPLQEDAIRAGLEHRDSLVVLPTGGGKSLCYQIPPLLTDRLDVVVSPLIALMKDQVDALRACGYPAAAFHSGMTEAQRSEAAEGVAAGKYRLIFAAPERLLTSWFMQLMQGGRVRAFAIDEAHCISHWGHDFRPEYRQLARLKVEFPGASLHAFTATATPRVRQDIVDQLHLVNPTILIGCFDRPNLVYRILPKQSRAKQTLEIIRRHHNEAAIVYCISRRDTEEMAAALIEKRIRAAFYHAGMLPDDRRRVQDDFAREKIDVVVATVAFGMGIDRSNVRCVIHAAMPKSVEQYQQETGRAGRDGLEAECVMLYSAADAIKWASLIEKSREDAQRPVSPEVAAATLKLLRDMQRVCETPSCRHRMLSEHFGQKYDKSDCGACDVCLDEVDEVKDSTIVAMKVLSCVARMEGRFGVTQVVDVLRGADTENVRKFGHDKLSTYGLLKEYPMEAVRDMVYQLVSQGLLTRTPGDYPVLQVNELSWEVMRKQREVKLAKPREAPVRKTKVEAASWENVDEELFEKLRALRRVLAEQRGVPAFVIFGDTSLRDMARRRPRNIQAFRRVLGVGAVKAEEYGALFVREIDQHCAAGGLVEAPAGADDAAADDGDEVIPGARMTAGARQAAKLFDRGMNIEAAAEKLGRAKSTVYQYLAAYIAHCKPADIHKWVTQETYAMVADIAAEVGTRRSKPIYDRLEGRIPYEMIRLVTAHIEATAMEAPEEETQ